MRGLAIVLGEPWMAVFYNTTNGLTVSDVQELCSANEARNSRVLTVCSLLKSEGTYNYLSLTILW